jgi:ribosomal protein L37AE/L43A
MESKYVKDVDQPATSVADVPQEELDDEERCSDYDEDSGCPECGGTRFSRTVYGTWSGNAYGTYNAMEYASVSGGFEGTDDYEYEEDEIEHNDHESDDSGEWTCDNCGFELHYRRHEALIERLES